MRKVLEKVISFVGLLAMMAVFAGCGGVNDAAVEALSKESPTEILRQVSENMAKKQNIEMDMTTELAMEMTENGNRESVESAVTMHLLRRSDPNQLYMIADVSAKENGNETAQSTELYLVPEGERYLAYTGTEEGGEMKWSKEQLTKESADKLFTDATTLMPSSSSLFLSENQWVALAEKSTNLSIKGQQEYNGEVVLAIEGSVDYAQLIQELGESGESSVLSQFNTFSSLFEDVTIPFTFLIDASTVTLKQCTLDLQPAMQELYNKLIGMVSGLTNGSETPTITMEKASVVMAVTAVDNQVGFVAVPEEVVESAEATSGTVTLPDETVSLPVESEEIVA